MITYQPKTPHSDAIPRPDCPQCGTQMRLFGIEAAPDSPGQELLSFECPTCLHIDARLGKSE